MKRSNQSDPLRRAFRKAKLYKRHQLVQEQGEYTAARFYKTFHVLLFRLDNFYVEVWKRIGTEQIYWIELVDSQRVLDLYLDNIRLKL